LIVGFAVYCLAILAIILYLRAYTHTRESFSRVNMEPTTDGVALVYTASNDVTTGDLNVNGMIKARSLEIEEGATLGGQPFATMADINNIQLVKGDKLCIRNTCLDEDGLKKLITPVTVPFDKIQVVHRRPIWGIGAAFVNQLFTFDVKGIDDKKPMGDTIYRPFAYAVPPVAAGATRKFRMYAVYSDNISEGPGPVISISILKLPNWTEQGKYVHFQFPGTWGAPSQNHHRDAYSVIVNEPSDKMHANMYTYIPEGTTGSNVKWQYVELQTLDVYP